MPREIASRTFSSGAPWHLTCRVGTNDGDYLCRIARGDRRIAAIAVSRWRDGRALTSDAASCDAAERALARFAAHALCAATRRTVRCVTAVCTASLTEEQIADLSQNCYETTRRAARVLADDRIRDGLADPAAVHAGIGSGLDRVVREVEQFLSVPLARLLHEHLAAIRESYAEHFRNEVRLFAPLYLSSACSNDCAYCGFRRSARFTRARLGLDRALAEARELVDQGHQTIDLVTGEVPSDPFVDYVAEATRRILAETGIRSIHLNLGSLSTEQYRRLRAAGATGYHLYQETYDPQRYFEVHRSGPKRDMVSRLDGAHRAVRAGFEFVGLGVLLGLHPIEQDLAALVRHAELLREDFPHVRLGFSLPRVREAGKACGFVPAAPVDDQRFAKALLYLRLRFPKASLTLTTRERAELRDRLIPLGISKLSAGVTTSPGGYAKGAAAGRAQFRIDDERSLADIAEVVRRAGRTPVCG